MGEYNYSPFFLEAHKTTVQQLIDLAKGNRAAEIRFDSAEEVRRYRNLILNLKRSLALNHPEMAYVHNTLRTSTGKDSRTSQWVLTIGPEHTISRGRKLRGAHFTMIEALPEVPLTNKITMAAFDPTNLRHSADLFNQISSLGKAGTEIQINQQFPPEALEWFSTRLNEVTGLGFEVVDAGPPLLLRVVQKASATSALPNTGPEASP